ncbi:MAG: putative DNA-binding domain-containing protein, partial [Myxococcales bacterium]|nr:putative DNA-binding domain-containing protein [Myxococcales bacterium]
DIYRRAYHARLIECLTDDYPVLAHALGEPGFERLCRAYIAAHPSGNPSLNFFGRHMAAFCREADPSLLRRRDFAADLAALEWAIVEVIHAPSSAPLTVDGLREVPLEAWAEARLTPNSAFRLLTFDHPVNAYFQAFREERDPAIPAPERAATAVYRSGRTVWRMDLTPPMHDVLSALATGETLEASLARAESGLAEADDEQAAARVLGWFREWVQSGLFARIDLA